MALVSSISAHARTAALAAALTALVTTHARTQDIPWNQIRDAAALDAAQKKVAAQALNTAPCYGGCDGTVLDCLLSGDPFGIRMANLIARRAAVKRPLQSILDSVRNRGLSAFPDTTYSIDLRGLVPSGNADAPVRVVVFADFECPFCRVACAALRDISREMPDSVSVWFKNYPLAQDDRAIPAALAHLAAERQGKGWEMHDLLFAHVRDLSDAALDSCATLAGLDLAKYHADIRSKELIDRVHAEKAEGRSYGIDKTPGILVNGKLYRGIGTKVELEDRIREEFDILGAGE
jgi:protein-disulfide isomerase